MSWIRRLLGRLPAPTIRVRLTALYTGLFTLGGIVLIALTAVLVGQRLPRVDPERTEGLTRLIPRALALGGDPHELLATFAEEQNRYRDELIGSLLTQAAIALAVVVVLSAGLGWLLAGRALAPVEQITSTARRVADRSLHERIGLSGPQDELTELADTFDAMLERLDRAFDGQRRFVGNAAHELRTPLTINRTLLEVELARPEVSDDLRRLGSTLLAVNARHERLIDGLLVLARGEGEITDGVTVDLAEVVAHVADNGGLDPAADGPSFDVDAAPAPVTGDPVLLERMVDNLVDNARRYNRPDGWVRVECGRSGDRVWLRVTNTGPSIAGYEVDGLFEPFRRGTRSGGDRVRSDRGVGLGLSIVRAVARSHGGSVTAAPHAGGGLEVRVSLPATSDSPGSAAPSLP